MQKGNDFSFVIEKIIGDRESLCMDPEVWFVLEGDLHVRMNDASFILHPEDVMLLSEGSGYTFRADEDVIVCKAIYSGRYIYHKLSGEIPVFICNSALDHSRSYQTLRDVFFELTENRMHDRRQSACMEESLLLKLLHYLLLDYQAASGARLQTQSDAEDSMRFQKIIQYIHANYQNDISLSELAESMYVSTSTLSRLFKKYAGVYYADFLSRIRLQHAVEELVFSKKNLTRIAVDNGFSGSSTFNRIFKKQYGMSPSEYRVQEQKAMEDESGILQTEEEDILSEIREKNLLKKDLLREQSVAISDQTKGKALKKTWGQCINFGTMYDMTLANIQYHILYLQEHLKIQYVRIWNVFSERLMITDGKTKGSYNFDMLDQVFDFLVKNRLKPYLDLGRKPNVIIRSDHNVVHYEEEQIPFASREIWEDFLKRFIRHLTDRYGREEVSEWIFELSRDGSHPDKGYYQAEQFDYFSAYRYAYRLIKKMIPGARVGGLSGIILSDWAYLADFYGKCVEENCIPDFASFLLYPYIPYEDERGERRKRVSPDITTESSQIHQMKKLLKQTGLEGCRLYISEFNNSVSNRNLLNDGCFRGAYLCRKLSEISQEADLICLMAGSDWINSYFDFNGVANGGVGLLTKDTICKPAYYAMFFMNMLGNHVIGRGDDYIATKDDAGDYYILCYNFKWFHKKYYLGDEDVDLRKDPDTYFSDSNPLQLDFEIRDLPDDEVYCIKTRKMDRREGSLIAEWSNLQFGTDLTRQDIRYLRNASFPKLRLEKEQIADGRLTFSAVLEEHEVRLIHIYMA
ncbi:MAG: helix-turn-helix domain-containing protein [Eubacterium sp.]|nr:helix-turn-helix domain-containing protein [Eubacterium sp.]